MVWSTEKRNERSMDIDLHNSLEIISIINEEDSLVAAAVKEELPQIARAVDKIVEAIGKQGRLIYLGAGTSGRLGVLDASECPPTYGTEPGLVHGIIAGGNYALTNAVENIEDSTEQVIKDLEEIQFSNRDVLVGIAASGRTPYVLAGLNYAKKLGATTVALVTNKNTPVGSAADIEIAVEVGPEVITGSTRMKSGTAQKMVLNMLSTASMVRLGKVYGNLMVDVKTANKKLYSRAERIVMQATGIEESEAKNLLTQCDYHVKTAIVMALKDCSASEARQRLDSAKGYIREAIS